MGGMSFLLLLHKFHLGMRSFFRKLHSGPEYRVNPMASNLCQEFGLKGK